MITKPKGECRPTRLHATRLLHERVVLLTVVTERAPFVSEAERMKVEPLDKGFTEMTLAFWVRRGARGAGRL